MTTLFDLPLRDMHEKEVDEGRFWINYVEGTNGGKHFRWHSLEEAKEEAERLARLPDVQGKDVYVLEYIEKCRVEELPVSWDGPDV